MDQPRFLLRAYAQDTREKYARRVLQVATYLSLLDTFVADTGVPFRAMCSACRVSSRFLPPSAFDSLFDHYYSVTDAGFVTCYNCAGIFVNGCHYRAVEQDDWHRQWYGVEKRRWGEFKIVKNE